MSESTLCFCHVINVWRILYSNLSPFFPGSFLQDSWCLGIGTASRGPCWFSNRHCQFQCDSSCTWPMESRGSQVHTTSRTTLPGVRFWCMICIVVLEKKKIYIYIYTCVNCWTPKKIAIFCGAFLVFSSLSFHEGIPGPPNATHPTK